MERFAPHLFPLCFFFFFFILKLAISHYDPAPRWCFLAVEAITIPFRVIHPLRRRASPVRRRGPRHLFRLPTKFLSPGGRTSHGSMLPIVCSSNSHSTTSPIPFSMFCLHRLYLPMAALPTHKLKSSFRFSDGTTAIEVG